MAKKRKNATAASESSYYGKRRRPSYPEGDEDDASSPSITQPRVDPTYGQRGAFPGLDDGTDELFYGPANNGLEYLKMVRSEARSVPSLLVARKCAQTEQDDTALDASRGYYADGAYTAAPTLGPSLPASNAAGGPDDERDPQDAYYACLRLRFSLLRATLRCTPPAERIAALDDNHPISLPVGSKHAFATWRRLLANTDPVPVQLASLDHGSVLRLLGMVTRELKRGGGVGRRGGAWVWGLLGRCREVGECGSDEVGVLRELGKRAVWVLKGWREGRDREQREEGDEVVADEQGAEEEEEGGSQIVEDGDGENDVGVPDPEQIPILPCSVDDRAHVEVSLPNTSDTFAAPPAVSKPTVGLDAPNQASESEHPSPDSDTQDVEPPTEAKVSNSDSDDHGSEANKLAAAKERIKARLDETVDAMHDVGDEASEAEDVTLATLDMILTVVGEFYGQRDLLKFRDLWDEML